MGNAPSIIISDSFAIGYDTPIATAATSMNLGAGNHFLLARNGRGKTTLLKTLSGGLKAKFGEYASYGQLQFVNEFLEFDRELTPSTVFKALVAKKRRKQALEIAETVELDYRKPFGKLSRGNRQKTLLILAECRAADDRPQILLLDEPFTGLDAFTQEFFLKHWTENTSNTLRLITCHPDSDEAEFPSVVTISNAKLSHLNPDSDRHWGTLKSALN